MGTEAKRSGFSPRHILLRLLWTGRLKDRPCTHWHTIHDVTPSSEVCEECVASGSVFVGLRMCATCGKVGCCETSKNHHARKHFEETGHPIIRGSRRDFKWSWCFIDRTLL